MFSGFHDESFLSMGLPRHLSFEKKLRVCRTEHCSVVTKEEQVKLHF